ncbi:diguanylate cyclase [Desulfosediminicola flagellatus]|uniref:diguanylate cyclase n=1 Tax=Desulfosediminicola flagellatus TaxID=2569541 RepID=UPI0010ABFD53|nr:diguanylate cyclase [Desulfosediminicola flagellatus]
MIQTSPHAEDIILIIDDQPANLSLLVEYLENKEIEVVVAENGTNGIARAKYVIPDLILLDVMMPGINGYETCQKLKADPDTADIPVIFMTALTDMVDLLKGFNSGGVDYLTKPVQFEEVWARINAHLTINHLRKDLKQKNTLLEHEIQERLKATNKIHSQNEFLHTVINSLPHPFYVIDADNYEVIIANTKAAPENSWVGKTCYQINHKNSAPCKDIDPACPMDQVKLHANPVIVEHIHIDDNGIQKDVEVHVSPILDDQGNVAQVIKYSMDITERKRLEEHLKNMAITDELTGLYNRRGLLTLTKKYLDMAQRQQCSLYLLYADLNNMKWVNDNRGHQAGDELLIETAKLLKETFRQSDIISRIGGDEFAVVLKDEHSEHNEQTITTRLNDNIRRRNEGNPKLKISISLGVARYDPMNPISLDELLSTADSRMYKCKHQMK